MGENNYGLGTCKRCSRSPVFFTGMFFLAVGRTLLSVLSVGLMFIRIGIGTAIARLDLLVALADLDELLDLMNLRYETLHSHLVVPRIGYAKLQELHDTLVRENVRRGSSDNQGRETREVVIELEDTIHELLNCDFSLLAKDTTEVATLIGRRLIREHAGANCFETCIKRGECLGCTRW
jgi:hypothetical protein